MVKMIFVVVCRDEVVNKIMTFVGSKSYSVREVIVLCEKFGGVEVKVSNVLVGLLKFICVFMCFF